MFYYLANSSCLSSICNHSKRKKKCSIIAAHFMEDGELVLHISLLVELLNYPFT